jgi:hypothetical protein
MFLSVKLGGSDEHLIRAGNIHDLRIGSGKKNDQPRIPESCPAYLHVDRFLEGKLESKKLVNI